MITKDNIEIMVSADDFGICPQATKNISQLIKMGKVDRVEVMMSKNLTAEEAKELLDSGIKVDIHLHLIKDKIDYWQKNPHIIESGIVKRMIHFFTSYLFGRGIPKKAEAEWETQIKEFIQLFGKSPDGISSHEHIHFFSPYFKSVLRLAKKYNISYIRLGKYSMDQKDSKVDVILSWLRERNKNLFTSTGLESSDYMVSFDWLKSLDSFMKIAPKGKKIEVVFHPELEPEYKTLENL